MKGIYYFENVSEYNLFTTGIITLFAFEILIAFFLGKNIKEIRKIDKISDVLVIVCWILCIFSGNYFRSENMPYIIKNHLLPSFSFYMGIILIYLGILIRGICMLTIKKEANDFKRKSIITTGIYSVVRNPAYLGSMMSLTGISLCYRNAFALIYTMFLCIICYGYRIKKEEKTLRQDFRDEFEIYCKKTKYRLIPYIF